MYGRKVSQTTIRKAIVTLKTVWRWGHRTGRIAKPFPGTDLRYPKAKEKPPFQTRAEIDRQIARGGLSDADQAELWDCLYLTVPEIKELLAFVEGRARQPFIYPMFVLAAHTGVRRSEMIRCVISDVDFEANTITIHERKKSHDRRTTRRVPMSGMLATVLKGWIENHPGGQFLFCQRLDVVRSKKDRSDFGPLTPDEANDHFQRTVEGSKWSVLKGWHTLRHSFISNAASIGIDQRMIQEWVGHLSAEIHRRYMHLLPNTQQQAINSVFDRK